MIHVDMHPVPCRYPPHGRRRCYQLQLQFLRLPALQRVNLQHQLRQLVVATHLQLDKLAWSGTSWSGEGHFTFLQAAKHTNFKQRV